jgi:hypothetical protein
MNFCGSLVAIIAITVAGVAVLYLTAQGCLDAHQQRIEIGSVLLAGCAKAAP